MYKKFCLSGIALNAADKKIVVSFNYDLDEASVNQLTLSFSRINDTMPEYKMQVVGADVIIKFKDWPVNANCYIVIDKNIANIAGDTLEKSYKHELIFKPEITSKVKIKSPYNFEKLKELKFNVSDTENFNSYYCEIAKENTFYNVYYRGDFTGNEFAPVIKEIEAGQYYVRFRVEKENEYGPWSDTVTFIYKYICDEDVPEEDLPSAEAEMPSVWDSLYTVPDEQVKVKDENFSAGGNNFSSSIEIETDLEVLSVPENGETPTQFIFEFGEDLDIMAGASVIVIKKDF